MQTIKRTAAIFLVLMLVLSCFSPVLTASASEPPGSAPAQTAATSPGADDPPPETATEANAETTGPPSETTAATEQTVPPTAETTAPTEETLPPRQMVSTLASFLESRDASVSITFSDGFQVEAGTQLDVTAAELDNNAMTACMETAGFLNILDYCVLNLDIPDADWEGTSFEMKVYFNSSAFRALNGNCVSVVRILPDGTMERLEATPLVEEKALKEVSFPVTDFSQGTKFAILSSDFPSILVAHSIWGVYAVQGYNYISVGSASRLHDITYHYVDSPSTPGYCLEPHKSFGYATGGGASSSTVSVYSWGSKHGDDVWSDLSENQRKAIALIAMLGLNQNTFDWGSHSSSGTSILNPVNPNQCAFAAAQIMVWEVVGGWRSFPDPSYCSNSRVIDNFDRGNVRSAYNTLNDKIRDWMNTTSGSRLSVENSQYKVSWVTSSDQVVLTVSSFAYETVTPPTGNISVTKNVSGTGSVQNWKFELYSSRANATAGTNPLMSAYTNSRGIATFSNVTNGTYYVREAPASRQDRVSTTGWTLSSNVLQGTVNGNTISVGSVTNSAPAGAITVKKAVTSANPSGKLSGWIFQVSKSSSFSSIAATITTNASGEGTTGNVLAPGTYYVREAPLANQTRSDKANYQLSSNVVTVTITGSETVLANNGTGVTATNVELSAITVQKAVTSASTSGKLDGWVFQIARDSGFANIVKTLTTDNTGFATTGINLNPGTYYVREAPMANQTRSDKDNFILDSQSVVTVTVQAGETKAALYTDSATAVNVEKGMIRVRKGVSGTDASAANLSGWLFYVYDSGKEVVAQITTGADGYGTSGRLAPGQYTVQEAPMEDQPRGDKAMWSQDAPPVTVTVTAGSTVDAIQDSGYTAQNQYGKRLSIQKTFRCAEETASQLSGNAMYSLAGAEYNVIVDGEVVETLVTNAEGKATSAKSYPIGTSGTLVEITAPAGFLLDSTLVEFTIPASGDYVVEVSDDPTFDPATQSFQKTDSQTGTAQGGAAFAGAIFRWDYYDNTDWSGDPVRTWYFVTDENGAYAYRPESLDSNSESSELYVDANGVPNLPLGSLKVTETAAPAGYNLMPVLYATITQKSNGGIADFDWTEESLQNIVSSSEGITTAAEPQDETTLGSLTIQKVDKGTGGAAPNGASFAGCEFTFYNRSAGPVKVGDHAVAQPGEVCYVLTVDETGAASTENIFPIGTYEVKETKGNEFYQCNTEWSETFTITGEEANPQVSVSCENEMLPATIRVQKVNPNDEALPGAKFLLEWSEDGTSWKPVTKSEIILAGGCSSEGLDDSGCLTTDDSGMAIFSGLSPMVRYRISEVATPNGYQLLKEPILVDKLTPEENYEAAYRVVDNYVFNLPKTGASDLLYLPICIAFAFTGFFLVLASDKTKSMYKKGTTK